MKRNARSKNRRPQAVKGQTRKPKNPNRRINKEKS